MASYSKKAIQEISVKSNKLKVSQISFIKDGKNDKTEPDEVRDEALCETVDGVANAAGDDERQRYGLHPVALLDRHEKRDGNDEAHDQREYAKPIRRIREDAPRSPGVVDEADVEKASEGTEEDASRLLACKQALRQLVEDHPDNGHGGEYACLLLRIRYALGCHS